MIWGSPSPVGSLGGAHAVERPRLLRRGLRLEYATLGWNVVGVVVLAVTAVSASSVALAAFGIDSLIEILASAVVVWQLRGVDDQARERRALRIIAIAFALLAAYIAVQATVTLATAHHPGKSVVGAGWLGVTAAVMLALAYGKADTGRRLGNPVLQTEARITVVDGALAVAVLAGVVLNAAARRRRLVVGRPRRGAGARGLRSPRGPPRMGRGSSLDLRRGRAVNLKVRRGRVSCGQCGLRDGSARVHDDRDADEADERAGDVCAVGMKTAGYLGRRD